MLAVTNNLPSENSRLFLELDIYLPKLKLAIEIDGLYWHSRENVQKNDRVKDRLCRERGIRLVRVTDAQVNERLEEVVFKVNSALMQVL